MAFRDEPFHVDGDLAFVLTEQFNSYAYLSEELELLTEEYVLDKLLNLYDPKTLAAMLADDFSRGLIMGQISYLQLAESVSDE